MDYLHYGVNILRHGYFGKVHPHLKLTWANFPEDEFKKFKGWTKEEVEKVCPITNERRA